MSPWLMESSSLRSALARFDSGRRLTGDLLVEREQDKIKKARAHKDGTGSRRAHVVLKEMPECRPAVRSNYTRRLRG